MIALKPYVWGPRAGIIALALPFYIGEEAAKANQDESEVDCHAKSFIPYPTTSHHSHQFIQGVGAQPQKAANASLQGKLQLGGGGENDELACWQPGCLRLVA